MLYKFSNFDPQKHFIVAPEGLNRFYTNGFGGDVVSSWMTKRDRLEEINDFSKYLSQLFSKYSDILPDSCKKIILAFSQGGTTAFRWLHQKRIKADVLIPYSCWIPEDINLQLSKTNLNIIKCIYTYGLQDEYLNKDRISQVENIITSNDLKIEIEPYEGVHRIEKTQLEFLFQKYINSD